MSPVFIVSFVLFGSIAILDAAAAGGLQFQCLDSGECSEEQCCAIGGQRYSVPQCLPMRAEGEPCRPDNEPQDYNLTYPGNLEVNMHVYYILCPCGDGLTCNRQKGGVCEKI